MICNKCGGNNPEGSNYCQYCRSQLTTNFVSNNNYNNTGFVYNQPALVDNSGFNRLTNPQVPFKKIAILLVIGLIILVICLVPDDDEKDKEKSNSNSNTVTNSQVVGTWSCNMNNFSTDDSKNYTTVTITNDGKFTLAKKGDETNNYYTGTYVAEKTTKTNGAGTASYYDIDVDITETKLDGKVTTSEVTKFEYEMGLDNSSNSEGYIAGALANKKTGTIYYCVKK